MKFYLDKEIIKNYKKIKPKFGFNGLGELTFYRTYSRLKEDGTNEDWVDCIERVVNTTYNIQKNHILNNRLKWNEEKAQRSAQEMFDRIFNMKFMPPGRGFWAMKPDLLEKVGGAALNNCAFVSTENIDKSIEEATKPFEFLMDMSMLGVGVGFDVKGAGKIIVNKSEIDEAIEFIIPDTREGWVESVKILIKSYFEGKHQPVFNYSEIRPFGAPIKTFGGVSSGYEPLKKVHDDIRQVLDKNANLPITERSIVDIMNMIGVCVVAGNVRRTAEIVFGTSEEFMDLKNYEKNPERAMYGWTSNNSIFAELGQDYSPAASRTAANGEPGYAWLENMKNYSRMKDKPDFKDLKVAGGNPCLEQSLESYELCCLVETYPIHHESLEDYERTLKFAYLYAKTVTLVPTHNEDTNEVMLRNRRIGLSQSGIAQFIDKKGIHEYKKWCEKGYETVQYYDKVYADWFKIPRSVKTTSVKFSGFKIV
jgi:ribonucleoside-triphosphate reductase